MNYVYIDSISNRDTTSYTEIKVNKLESKEPPMYVNYLVTIAFLVGAIIVMMTRPTNR